MGSVARARRHARPGGRSAGRPRCCRSTGPSSRCGTPHRSMWRGIGRPTSRRGGCALAFDPGRRASPSSIDAHPRTRAHTTSFPWWDLRRGTPVASLCLRMNERTCLPRGGDCRSCSGVADGAAPDARGRCPLGLPDSNPLGERDATTAAAAHGPYNDARSSRRSRASCHAYARSPSSPRRRLRRRSSSRSSAATSTAAPRPDGAPDDLGRGAVDLGKTDGARRQAARRRDGGDRRSPVASTRSTTTASVPRTTVRRRVCRLCAARQSLQPAPETRKPQCGAAPGTGATGLEPATSGVTGRRSNRLSYAPARRASEA